MKKVILLVIVMVSISCAEKPYQKAEHQVAHGQLFVVENFPSNYITPRNVFIWLPDDYNEKTNYNVLYMHDGQMLFDATKTWNKQEWGVDEVMTGLLKEQKIKPTIVVGIWNTDNRHAEYFPQKAFEMLPKEEQDRIYQIQRDEETKLFNAAVVSDNYLSYIVQEIKPFIDKYFSTNPDKEATFMAGSSMGGLISWYALCEYPHIFGGAACMSTHWPGIMPGKNNPVPEVFYKYLRENLPEPSAHKIYFDYGTETLDAYYEPYQKVVDSIMQQKGFTAKQWQTLKFQGHKHDEISWHKRLDKPLAFLLGIH